MACAVILPKDCDILYINDSKKLTAAKRDELIRCHNGKGGFCRNRDGIARADR